MTDERFSELVDLYLDKEISADELKLLKAELASNPNRMRAFSERCRLHQAMRLALDPERSNYLHFSCSEGSDAGRRLRKPEVALFTRWVLGSGVAASVLVALILLPAVMRDTTDASAQRDLVVVADTELPQSDPLDMIGKSELRRFANTQQQRAVETHASLVSQMRLLGLRPELTPRDKDLREVSLATVQEVERSVSQAELFQRLQGLRAIPEQELLRLDEVPAAPVSWPGNFQSSLVSFGN